MSKRLLTIAIVVLVGLAITSTAYVPLLREGLGALQNEAVAFLENIRFLENSHDAALREGNESRKKLERASHEVEKSDREQRNKTTERIVLELVGLDKEHPIKESVRTRQDLEKLDKERYEKELESLSRETEKVDEAARETEEQEKQKSIPLTLTLKPDGRAETIARQKYVFTITNVSGSDIVLDRQSLNPVISLVILDEQGNEVPKIAPWASRESSEKDALALKPGKDVTLTFALSDVTVDVLDGKKYELFCRYYANGQTAPEAPKPTTWRGVLETRRLTLGQR